ncbi:hypothetical protein PENSPDRAFT_750633 [Peniophora sp. CONT]|nr:hypothetical protein PENSPDRAFT_750633 [Peniophora sp. CONT]
MLKAFFLLVVVITASTRASPTGSVNVRRQAVGTTFTGGHATFFTQNGGTGACGVQNVDSTLLAAIAPAPPPAIDGLKPGTCGRQLRVVNTQNNKEVVVIIQDVCPSCTENSLDLSLGAFDELADESSGIIPIKYTYIS